MPHKGWAPSVRSLGMWPFSRQLCVGSPPGVWVCSTDMLLTVPSAPGEWVPALRPAPPLAWDRGRSLQWHSWLSLRCAPMRVRMLGHC